MTGVLIADDHRFFRAGLQEALTSAGYEVLASVGSGQGVLDAINEGCNPGVIVLDIRMPELDGVTTLEILRANADERPVIMLAAEVSDDELVRLLKAGSNAIVMKNAPEADLLHTLAEVRSGTCCISSPLMERAIHALARDTATEDPILGKLSPREREVAELAATGLRNREIADRIGLTEGTVKVCLHSVYSKLGVANRTGLANAINSL